MAKSNRCSFCGSDENQVNLMLMGMTGCICDACIERANITLREAYGIEEETKQSKKEFAPQKKIPKPREIKKYLDEYVIGQDEAKRFLSVAVYNQAV